MAVRLEKHLHHNHANNTRETSGNIVILQGDYGIGDPQLDDIQSLIEKVSADRPIQRHRKYVYLFSSLGTIEYALEMSGYSASQIAAFFQDKRNTPQCFVEGDTIYIACHDLDMTQLESEMKEIL